MTTNQSEYKIEFPKFDFADSLNANSEDYLMSSYKIALNNNVEQSVPVHEMPDGELEFDKADETFSSKHVLQEEETVLDAYCQAGEITADQTLSLMNLGLIYLEPVKNPNAILFLMQHRFQNYNVVKLKKQIRVLFKDCYKLSVNLDNVKQTDSKEPLCEYPFDELFIWSLFMYDGSDDNLMYYYWSLSSNPLSCLFVAMIIYAKLRKELYIPEELKTRLLFISRDFEKMAIDVLKKCFKIDTKMTEDLLIREIDLFCKTTMIELALEAQCMDFMSQNAIQILFTDIWFGKLNPETSYYKIIPICLFVPLSMLPIPIFRNDLYQYVKLRKHTAIGDANKLQQSTLKSNDFEKSSKVLSLDKLIPPFQMRKNQIGPIYDQMKNPAEEVPIVPNEKLVFRGTDQPLKGLYRLYHFINSPLVKYFNHLTFYILFLVLFSFFILFDFRPLALNIIDEDKGNETTTRQDQFIITLTETAVLVWGLIMEIDEIRQFWMISTFKDGFIKMITNGYLRDEWAIFNTIMFLLFDVTIIFRFIPVFFDLDEHAVKLYFRNARILYSISLILWFIRVLSFFAISKFWGSKIIVIKELSKKISVILVLTLIFFIPFAFTTQSVIEKPEQTNLSTFAAALARAFWPFFDGTITILKEFEIFKCKNSTPTEDECNVTFETSFLYISLGLYVIIYHLLLLDLIIATFTSSIEQINLESVKSYNFQCYRHLRYFHYKTVTPAPFVFFEYIFLIFKSIFECSNKNRMSKDCFRIQNYEKHAEKRYLQFEEMCRNRVYDKRITDKAIKSKSIFSSQQLDELMQFIERKFHNHFERLSDGLHNLFKQECDAYFKQVVKPKMKPKQKLERKVTNFF